MGELTDKIKGNANEAIGKIKQSVADSNDDAKLGVEGKDQELKGKAQKLMGEVKGSLGDNV